MQKALAEGVGDIVAYGVVVTPEREKEIAFSTPLLTDVKQVIVTGPDFGVAPTLEDLGGKEVYVNPLTTYYQNLQVANESLKKSGKTPIVIRAADKNLTDDDLVQMVNAGLIPATVTIQQRADLWSQVLPKVQSHPNLVIASGQNLAWAMRKNNPQLKDLVDEFVGTELHFFRGDEEASGKRCVFPKIRWRLRLRCPDDCGSGLPGISAGSEQEGPQRRCRHYAGNPKVCGGSSDQHTQCWNCRTEHTRRRENVAQYRRQLL
jgi:hypothetical protein